MKATSKTLSIAFAALALVTLGGCKKNQPPPAAPPVAPARVEAVKVVDVQLGTALGPDKKITAPTTVFAKKDMMFASVTTEGAAPSAELAAKWTYQDGQVVNETKRAIAPGPTSVTEFSIQKPDGWPAGDYKVEISLDGKPVDSKTFKVQ